MYASSRLRSWFADSSGKNDVVGFTPGRPRGKRIVADLEDNSDEEEAGAAAAALPAKVNKQREQRH